MSDLTKARTGSASSSIGGKDRESGQRFTPLRSYVTKARALAEGAREELALTRIVPKPIQG